MKGTRIVNGFLKKILVWSKLTILDPKMTHLYNSGLSSKGSLKILHKGRKQEVYKSCINDFSEKFLIWEK